MKTFTASTAALAALPLITTVRDMGIWFTNYNARQIYISADWGAGDLALNPQLAPQDTLLDPKASVFLPAPPHTSPKYFLGLSPNTRSAEVGDKRDFDTVVEPSFADFAGFSYFDVDVERGFSVPVVCESRGGEVRAGCEVDLLESCPADWGHWDGQGVLDQCRSPLNGASDALWRAACPGMYVRTDDERTATMPEGQHVISCTISGGSGESAPRNAPRESRFG